ncbi:hypothetical protein GCM10022286_23010 [Gryllotalpicola daejeonensis]|uniref:Lipoprotein with Yx(FWY)xxD motif n=1 Tax=Gryllotalpicola daejeonensis TaxID=993087 RepID=A0ABP7ZM38_9MICO
MSRKTIALSVAIGSLAALVLAGCSGNTVGSAGAYGGTTPKASSSPAGGGSSASSGDTLTTASSSLGKIVVDGKGMTVYFYGKDTKGEKSSACTGVCLALWPAVTASGTPKVTGVTGKVGTIAGPNGTKQVTIDGLPIYTFSGDSAAGEVTGQLYENEWWAVAPDGAKITTSASTSDGSGSAGGY